MAGPFLKEVVDFVGARSFLKEIIDLRCCGQVVFFEEVIDFVVATRLFLKESLLLLFRSRGPRNANRTMVVFIVARIVSV